MITIIPVFIIMIIVLVIIMITIIPVFKIMIIVLVIIMMIIIPVCMPRTQLHSLGHSTHQVSSQSPGNGHA